MTSELIEKFLNSPARSKKRVFIHFKQRKTVSGIFLKTDDYNELKTKNFWRIVADSKIEEFEKTNDNSLARIYNGAEFTRLSDN